MLSGEWIIIFTLVAGILFLALLILWDTFHKKKEVEKGRKIREVKGLIKLVDNNFEIRSRDIIILHPLTPLLFAIAYFTIFVFIYVLLAPLEQKMSISIVWIGLGVTFAGVYFSLEKIVEEKIVKRNYNKMSSRVEENKKPLLKALIKMKIREPDFDLEKVYEMDDTLFIVERLLERLYE